MRRPHSPRLGTFNPNYQGFQGYRAPWPSLRCIACSLVISAALFACAAWFAWLALGVMARGIR